jgi:DNA polymerase-3 subunit beta
MQPNGARAQFSLVKADLVRELSLAVGAVERKTTIPILGNVRLEASDFGHLAITATDLEIGMQSRCPAEVKTPGVATLPAKRLLDYVRLLPDGQVEIEFAENDWATIRAGRSKTRMAGLSAESFPELPAPPDSGFDIPLKTLARMIRRVLFAISLEQSRFTLEGALFEVGADSFRMVATDGHRLAFIEVPCGAKPEKTIIPRKAMVEVLKLAGAGAGETVHVNFDENHIFFQVGERTLTARQLTGAFPEYARVLPKSFKGTAKVNVREMRAALDRARVLSNDRRVVKLNIADGQLTVSSGQMETSETNETILAEVSGPSLEIGFNGDYLADFLAVVETEHAVLSYNDATTAVQFAPVGEEGTEYRCIVMPMRV